MTKKWIVITFLTIIILLMSTYLYARYVEPKKVTITCNYIKSKYIPNGFSGMKVVQFSDTHLGPNFTIEQLKELVNQMNMLKPDIVVFTGDLIDNFGEYGSQKQKAQSILTQIHAPLGKYAVFGNHDRGGGGSYLYNKENVDNSLYKKLMEGAGFTVLVNAIDKITSANGDQITIAGLDDFLLGMPKIPGTLQQLQQQDFNLLLVHEPDVADKILEYPVDFQISGHSHGGQVRFPFLKPIITTPLANQYVEGMYSLEGKKRSLQLYVNRGIGTTRAPFRLFCKPELSIFILQRVEMEY
ncbi:metallophosphoesterase [Bacillus thuringiensis]|uniref:Metallophosphoesterase n=1 Tax=Bacillus thuringiensis TaxID=1428 RepID=A0A9X6TL90_BACTU|nr:metallophosphoesterase [Bacillus thuringiensis]PEA88302.1 metallophosphoesterase [Bacillus thuringiensis]